MPCCLLHKARFGERCPAPWRDRYAITWPGENPRAGARLGISRHVERYWRAMLRSRSQKGKVHWEVFLTIKRRYPPGG